MAKPAADMSPILGSRGSYRCWTFEPHRRARLLPLADAGALLALDLDSKSILLISFEEISYGEVDLPTTARLL